MTDRPRVGASVDLGSTSVHLLVASIEGHRLRPLVDESAFLGLGAAVDVGAHLGAGARHALVETLASYCATARGLGAAEITLIGTEPIRRAADASRIVAEVEAGSGVPLHVLTHEEEAYLTLIGVTHGRPVTHETLVIDIGGGSSEFCAVGPASSAQAAGLRLGANRLTSRFATADPPTEADLSAMRNAADAILCDAVAATPAELVIVGGTASNIVKVTAAGIADPVISRARLEEARADLGALSAEAIAARYGVKAMRARLLPAGVVIVDALMRRYGMERVRVSDQGMREGAILVADHAGRGWRDRLADLAHGWRT